MLQDNLVSSEKRSQFQILHKQQPIILKMLKFIGFAAVLILGD